LPFSCVLQFTSDSASLVLSFALDVPLRTPPFPSTSTYALSSRCRRNRHRLAENPQLALHKVCASLFSITYDGSMVAQKCSCLLIWSFKFCPFFSPVFRMLYAPLTASFLNRHFFITLLFLFIVHRTGFHAARTHALSLFPFIHCSVRLVDQMLISVSPFPLFRTEFFATRKFSIAVVS